MDANKYWELAESRRVAINGIYANARRDGRQINEQERETVRSFGADVTRYELTASVLDGLQR